MLIDLHTHHFPERTNGKTIFSLSVANKNEMELWERQKQSSGLYLSVGLHPWQVNSQWEKYAACLRQISKNSQVIAIGEAGLDKSQGGIWNDQLQAFEFQALLAEERKLPLIIHCVKSMQEIIAFKKKLQPTQPWIIHGFRGKPTQAQQLWKLGFYLSLGEHCPSDTLQSIPSQALFLETDESTIPIEELYRKAATLRNVSMEELIQQININFLIFPV